MRLVCLSGLFAVMVGAATAGCDKKPAPPAAVPAQQPSAQSPSTQNGPVAAGPTGPAPTALPTPAFAPSPATRPSHPAPAFTLDVAELQQEWAKDGGRAAVEKYGGEVLDVKGVVREMSETYDHIPYVMLWSPDRKVDVQCLMRIRRPWAYVGSGQEVTIRGLGNTNRNQSPVTDGEIAAAGASRTYRMPAAEVVARYLALEPNGGNPFAAGGLFPSFVVTGTVTSVEPKGDTTNVMLEGTAGVGVRVTLEGEDAKAAAQLKPGATLTVFDAGGPVFSRSDKRIEMYSVRLAEP